MFGWIFYFFSIPQNDELLKCPFFVTIITTIMRLEPDKKLHSREHMLAEDLTHMLGEPKKFAAYLGIAKRYEERDLRALARMVREKADLPKGAYGRYFFACLRSLAPTHEYLAFMRHKKRKSKFKKKNAKRTANRQRTASRPAPKSAGNSTA